MSFERRRRRLDMIGGRDASISLAGKSRRSQIPPAPREEGQVLLLEPRQPGTTPGSAGRSHGGLYYQIEAPSGRPGYANGGALVNVTSEVRLRALALRLTLQRCEGRPGPRGTVP